jgi:VWFA-related protein
MLPLQIALGALARDRDDVFGPMRWQRRLRPRSKSRRCTAVAIDPTTIGTCSPRSAGAIFSGRRRGRSSSRRTAGTTPVAERTGGRAFFPSAVKDLASVYQDIRHELASQYSLAYQSNSSRGNGGWRRITVRVNRPGVTVRTRQRYYAAGK